MQPNLYTSNSVVNIYVCFLLLFSHFFRFLQLRLKNHEKFCEQKNSVSFLVYYILNDASMTMLYFREGFSIGTQNMFYRLASSYIMNTCKLPHFRFLLSKSFSWKIYFVVSASLPLSFSLRFAAQLILSVVIIFYP